VRRIAGAIGEKRLEYAMSEARAMDADEAVAYSLDALAANGRGSRITG
jgi:hypothetical protein